MHLALGSDHAGFDLKERLKPQLEQMGVTCDDCGCASADPVDYPDIAETVARKVAAGTVDRGILICGTGIGMALAANKVDGIRAAPVCSEETAALARRHNDLNVLALGARVTPVERVLAIVHAFLETPFDGGRHQRRLDKIARLEGRAHPAQEGEGS